MDMQLQLNKFSQPFIFLANKLKHYSSLSLGEQIAYPVTAAGLLLILISIIMFIL